jgi:hypothetical protein
MMVCSEVFFELRECFFDAVDRFVYHNRVLFPHERFEHSLASLLDGKKSEIEILMTVDPTRNQC